MKTLFAVIGTFIFYIFIFWLWPLANTRATDDIWDYLLDVLIYHLIIFGFLSTIYLGVKYL